MPRYPLINHIFMNLSPNRTSMDLTIALMHERIKPREDKYPPKPYMHDIIGTHPISPSKGPPTN